MGALAYADDSKKPYGDVEYADSGLQPDGKKRYPLDSEEHCRAAWSYINMPRNAAKYSPDELARIKGKIRSALKRYGVEVSDGERHTAASLRDLELARPGTYKLASGSMTFTEEMLADAARYATAAGRPAPVKLGHVDKRWDGEPALGWLSNLRYEEDADGPVLLGDIDDMPEWLAAAAPKHWPNRSVEGWANYTDADGERYAFVIDGLALLGATPPGINSIKSLRDLPAALGVAASARIVASFGDPTTDLATEATGEPTKGADGMTQPDPAQIREALGLSADASVEEVRASLVAAGIVPEQPEQQPQPVAASAAPGTKVIDEAAWVEREARIASLEAAEAKRRVDERDRIIAAAVADGKFPPARKGHWVRLWDADPEGTRAVLATLSPNVMPVMASGYDGDPDTLDDEYRHLFPPTAPVGKVS